MVPLNELNAETIMSRKVLEEVFDQEDEIYKAELLASLALRASELRVKSEFKEVVAAYKKLDKELRAQKQRKQSCLVNNWTNFSDSPYDQMICKNWIAADDGIYTYNSSSGTTDILACYHPILPIERLKNLETGEEQLKLAYRRNGHWNEIIVPKTMVTSASKIVALSGRGIAVTSENAKYLVRYLADVENSNEESIEIQYSSSKLGWINGEFIPYDSSIIFDGDARFKQVFESVSERGSFEIWKKHIKELRASGRMEVKFLLAASFASVLIHPLGSLPFFVDLWGETEGGKTVSLMVAASVWANPDESRYIGDFKTTDVALEAKADMLNHLPMFLDDTSKVSSRIRDNFESVVYDLCSGKGKSRSNKELGVNRENRWKNIIICNGERPLNSYVNQGGAINRILEIECGEKIYSDPQKTADMVKRNYGHAGRYFVELLKEIGVDKVREIAAGFQKKLFDSDKMQKQSISLSVVLAADKIVTDHIFKDGCYITLKEAKSVLVDRNELSDNERCYQYILDKVSMNGQRFDDETKCEKWGIIEDNYAIFYNSAFEQICKDGGFSKKSFLSWADKKGLLQTQGGRYNKVKKIDGNAIRCIFLQIAEDDSNEFMEVGENYRLPFD